MRELIKEGRDVNDAIDLACEALGVARDTVDFEIISLPKRGFLGLKNTPAKVRVYIEEPELPKKPVAPVAPPKPAPPVRDMKTSAPTPGREARPVVDAPAPAAKPAEKPIQPLRPMPQDLQFTPMQQLEGKSKVAAEYIDSVLREIGVQADITVANTEGGIIVRLSGDGLGVVIGRRGETLDALQYLSSLVANRADGDYLRVTIDSGNYREKRERTLQQLARKISQSAVRFGRASTLEPMNPYERRIIHATVSEIEGVTSSSIGEEPNRRVVITPTNPRPQGGRPSGPRPGGAPRGGNARPPRRNDNRDGTREGGRDGNRDNRFGGDRRRNDAPRPAGRFNDRPPMGGDKVKPTSTDLDRSYAEELTRQPELGRAETPAALRPQTSAPQREKTPEEGKDMPLYGKIDI